MMGLAEVSVGSIAVGSLYVMVALEVANPVVAGAALLYFAAAGIGYYLGQR